MRSTSKGFGFDRTFGFLAPLVLGTLAAATAWSSDFPGQTPQCSEREEIVGALNSELEEHLAAVESTENGLAYELFTSTDGGWTVILSFPDGRSCMIATGADERLSAQEAVEDPET